jgi:signal transduction histidine kinase
MINARSDDLTYHMDTLLDMSRLQAGRLRLDIDVLPLSELIRKLTGHFDFDLRRQQRTLDIALPAEPLEVAWDAPRIERVLINLVGNALKYSPEGGAVDVRVRQLPATEGDMIELAVTDHGIGIPPAERERIFERFYRAPQAVSERFRGSGLGLYICRSVVEAHGGRIWAADAIHGGQGTSMFVVLPRQAAAGEVAEA